MNASEDVTAVLIWCILFSPQCIRSNGPPVWSVAVITTRFVTPDARAVIFSFTAVVEITGFEAIKPMMNGRYCY